MNMHLIDWAIVGLLLILLIWISQSAKRYTRSVADFLAANRCAGRYLIAVAGNMSSIGAISVLAWFDAHYKAGFSAIWWGMLYLAVPIIISLSGFLIYRFRETRAMTMAQFFETRYSRKFRIFSGMLAFGSGILNFGIFPSAGAYFFIYFCGLPEHFYLSALNLPTYPVLMFALVLLSLYFTFSGGQIVVMLTDFVQGVFCNFAFIIIMAYILYKFDWSVISATLVTAPHRASLVNPFDSSKVQDFDPWFFLIGCVGMFYNLISWQGSQGFNCCAKNPHEQKMGRALGTLRALSQSLLFVLIPIAAYTVMHNPNYVSDAAIVNEKLAHISNPAIQDQMIVPIAATTFLGKGMLGLLCAIMLASFISNNSAYLHSWGAIAIQDVVMPLRKKPLSQKTHMNLLRISISFVALFAFVWSWWYPQNESIFMYFAITGAVYLGGAGAVIIGGLYWHRGTTTAAWWTLIIGSILSVSSIIVRHIYPAFPINSQWMYLFSMLASCLLYVVISLLGPKSSIDLNVVLNRQNFGTGLRIARSFNWKTVLETFGITDEMGLGDKLTFFITLGAALTCMAVFTIGCIWNFIDPSLSDSSWLKFWWVWMIVSFIGCLIITIWLTAGGIRDTIHLFRTLSEARRDTADDGSVKHDQAAVEQVSSEMQLQKKSD